MIIPGVLGHFKGLVILMVIASSIYFLLVIWQD
jgi:hypothetical protein